MTNHQPEPGTDPAEAYATEYRRLWDATVATLTAAVQLDHPQHGPVDFSDFLASALGAVAANVGSANRITAGRPGSWESDALSQLVAGTVGYDAQLVTEAYQDASTAQRETMLPHVDDAAQVIYRAAEEWSSQHPEPGEGAPAAEWEAYEKAADAQAAQEQAAEELLRARYAATFQAYAEAFNAAVLDEARTIDGLTVAVEVQAETNPEAGWWDPTDTINPADDERERGDALAWHLWAAARDRVPLPRALVEIPAEAAEEEQ